MALLELLVKSPAVQTEIDEICFPGTILVLSLTKGNISEKRDDKTNVWM